MKNFILGGAAVSTLLLLAFVSNLPSSIIGGYDDAGNQHAVGIDSATKGIFVYSVGSPITITTQWDAGTTDAGYVLLDGGSQLSLYVPMIYRFGGMTCTANAGLGDSITLYGSNDRVSPLVFLGGPYILDGGLNSYGWDYIETSYQFLVVGLDAGGNPTSGFMYCVLGEKIQ